MKDRLKGFLKISHNGVEVSVNPLQIETYQPYQAHNNPDTDKILIVMASGQTFIVSNKDFDLEGWEKGQEAKLVAEREAEKARREQEKKDLEEIVKNVIPPLSEEDKADMTKKAGELGTQIAKNRADRVTKTLKNQK